MSAIRISGAIGFTEHQEKIIAKANRNEEHTNRLYGREEKLMVECKSQTVRNQVNPVREDDQVNVSRASLRQQNSKLELDRRLDQALTETFPASDSIAVIIC